MTPLHHMGHFFRELLLQVPLGWVRAAFLLLLGVLLLWVIFLPRQHAEPEGGTQHPAENLKLWAVLALLIQLLIYSFL